MIKLSNGTARKLWNLINFACALGFVLFLLALAFHRLDYQWNWSALTPYGSLFLQGWGVTIALSAGAMLLSIIIGLASAFFRIQPILILRHLSLIYTEIIRGTPLLVQILIFFYVVADAVGLENRYIAGVLILSIFNGAYLSEIFRAGLESSSTSQLESARAIGLSNAQIYYYVIFPQAFRQCLPPLAGQFASLIKDSSLLSIIAISELTLNAQSINSFTYSTLESYLPLACGYLALTLPITWLARSLERKFVYET